MAADGANSPIRRTLAVATSGRGSPGHYLNVYFEADLAALMRGRKFSMLLQEPDVTGFLLTINNTDRLRYYPERGQQPADFTAPILHALVHRVLGLPEVPLRILSTLPQEMSVRTVAREQVGRVFLAGDAAHTMTPYAGKRAATGVQDVHNLAWKLATVLRRQAGPTLLATYGPEPWEQPTEPQVRRMRSQCRSHYQLSVKVKASAPAIGRTLSDKWLRGDIHGVTSGAIRKSATFIP